MVTVGIIGGGDVVAQILHDKLGFQLVSVTNPDDALLEDIPMQRITLNDHMGDACNAVDKRGITATDFSHMNDMVTKNWTDNFVFTINSDVDGLAFLHSDLIKRPFFLLLHYISLSRAPSPAEYRIIAAASPQCSVLTVIDDAPDHAALFSAITRTLLPSLAPSIRPSWDTYFMHLAHLASLRSNCMKRRVGCIIVHSQRVVATGYNGTPSGLPNCSEGGCTRCNGGQWRSGERLDECLCLHAEENAILEAGRGRAAGGTLYCTTKPCLGCAKKLIQVGIRRVVWNFRYSEVHTSEALFAAAGVQCEQQALPERTMILS